MILKILLKGYEYLSFRDSSVTKTANFTVSNLFNQNLMKAGTRNMFANLNYTPTNILYTYLWS